MKRTATAMMVVLLSMIYAVFCQAQILGTGQLGTARRSHTATLLQDGKVLIVGGDDANGLVSQAEIFDPATLTASNIAANPLGLRTDHTATLLTDGRVLIVGGVDANGLLASSEFYNPYSVPAPSFTAGPALLRARSGHTATVLANGKVLIVGGEASGSAEIYDPATQSFSLAAGSLNTPRQYHSAVLLNSGKVLIAGGVVGVNTTLTSAEIYDPQTQTFTPASGPMQTPRGLALLRVLPDGKVQVIGGDGEFSMEMFDPATNSFIALAHIPPHEDYLNNILASRTRSALITTIIQQNPVLQGRPELTTEFIVLLNRLDHTVTEIPQSNQALIAGGVNDAGQVLSSATVVSSSAATITTDKFDYAPGEIVTITGSGFQPNETVWMLFHEEPETHTDVVISSVADGQGKFTNTDFAPSISDLNRSFTLTAIGQSSNFTAQTAFHDNKNVSITFAGAGSGTVVNTQPTPANLINCTSNAGVASPAATCTNIAFGNNDQITLSATPAVGSIIGGWSIPASTYTINSGCGSADLTCQFTMNNTAQTITVTFKKNLTASVTAANKVYNGTTSATITACTLTGVLAADVGNVTCSVGGTSFADKNVGNGKSVTATGIALGGSAATKYALASTTATTTANITAKLITVTAVTDSKTYDGNISSSGAPTIAPALASGDSPNFTQTFNNKIVGTSNKTLIPSGTVNDGNSGNNYSYTFVNFTTGTITARALTVSATGVDKVYDATTAAAVTLSDNRVLGDVLTTSYTSASFADSNVGSGKTVNVSGISISGTDAGNYTFNTTAITTANITKADSTTTLSATGSFIYDALAHAATANVTGVGGLNQLVPVVYSGACSAAPVNVAETPCTVTATFAGDANHNGSSATGTITITKATPTVTVSGGPFTYDGNPHAATVTVTGVGGAPVSGSATLNYAGVPPTSYGPSTTAPTDAGTYQARSVFTSSDSNYNNAQGSGSITINKAASVTIMTVAGGETFTYDGNAHPATVSVTGAGGLNLSPAPVYSCGHAPIDVADSGCTASYTYVGDANHLGSSDSKAYTISKATPLVTVTGGTFTYDGNSHGATVAVTGIGGAVVSGSANLNYAGIPPTSYGPTTTAPTDAGTYQVRSVFTSSDNNYTNAQGTGQITINKADSTTTLSGTGSFTYDALAHGATANVTGAGGLNQSVSVVYSGYCLAAPVSVNETPCTVTAIYVGDANHNGSNANGSIIITKADASITVNGYTGAYDGVAHGASGSALGVGGVNLAASLNLGATFINVPGGTAVWAFSGGVNYNDAGGSVAIVITKANPIVTATGNTCTYTGSPCAGSGAATGVNSESLAPVNIAYRDGLGALMTSAPINAGVYQVAARYAGDVNYNPMQSMPATITINQATQAITVGQEPPASAYYNQSFTVTATANSGLIVAINGSGSCSGSGNGSASITMNAGFGTCAITFDQSGDSNYQAAVQVLRSVTALNTAPVAQAQSLATSEDVPVEVTLIASDIDNGSVTFNVVTPSVNGSLSSNSPLASCMPNGIGAICTATVTYSPVANFNGVDSFSFKVNDGQVDSNLVSVSITVKPVNDAPTANELMVAAQSGTPIAIALTGSDLETLGSNLTFKIGSMPLNGSLMDGSNNVLAPNSTLIGSPATVIYTPALNYQGPDTFTFTVGDRGDPDNCGVATDTCDNNKSSPIAMVSISVTDATAPDTIITAMPALLSNDPNPIFAFTGTDNITLAGDLLFECRRDAGAFLPCTSPVNYNAVADGAHTFQVRAKDLFGNLDGLEASYTWTIDATPPDTVIDSGPSSLTNVATATFIFHATENNSTFLCWVDSLAATCGGGTFTTASLVDGEHTFTVAAVDLAGNIDQTPATVTWVIDTLAPQTTINSGPANLTANTSATFTFGGVNVNDAFQCSLDNANFTTCSSPITHTGLGLGNHMFRVRAIDSAGNMDATPASYSWTIGAVTLENYAMDSDFKRFDGFDVVFGKGSGSSLKINSTNPDSFHYQIRLTNNTGTPIGAAYGNLATTIITVPNMPVSCGGVPCSSQISYLGDPAFVIKGRKVAHVWPGHHDRDDDDDDDDMPVATKYMTLAQYQANGNSCADNPNYSSTLPSNGAAKCIKITGFSIPVKHAARIRLNFNFRLKGTDGWNANAQQLFYVGFVFRASTSVSFGANVQTASDATGLVGAGKKATAIGGYVFNGINPGTGYQVRLFTKTNNVASCGAGVPVAQDQVDPNGFYYIWRAGLDQDNNLANSLPSGVQYTVQLCNGITQVGLKSIDSKLHDKEFEQVDFDY